MFKETRIRGSSLHESIRSSQLKIYDGDQIRKSIYSKSFHLSSFLGKVNFPKSDWGEINRYLSDGNNVCLALVNTQRGSISGIVAGTNVQYCTQSALRINILAVEHGSVNRERMSEVLDVLKQKSDEKYKNCVGIVMTAKTGNLGDMRLINSIPWSADAVYTTDSQKGTYTVYDPIVS